MTSALDQKGLEAAKEVMRSGSGVLIMGAAFDETMEAAIRAYLSTVIPADIREVVEKLKAANSEIAETSLPIGVHELLREAATLIERLAASQAETRRQALEEAAKVAEAKGESYRQPTQAHYDFRQGCHDAAAAIRSLMDQPSTEGGMDGE